MRITKPNCTIFKLLRAAFFLACLGTYLRVSCTSASASSIDATDVGPTGGYVKDHGSHRVIVFVHGLFSSPEAWRCDKDHYWPAMIASDTDPAFADTDIYVVGYPTPRRHGKMTISDLDTVIMNRMEADGVFSRHREVVFVAHSLGGLLTQQLLLTYRDKELYKKVSFIYLFGTPQEGSKLANIGKYFIADPLLKELQEGNGNFILHDMNDEWIHAGFKSIRRFCAYETQPEHGFKVVDQNSATRECDDTLALQANHRDMVKPCSTKDDAYLALKNKLSTVTLDPDRPEPNVVPTMIVSAPNGIANGTGTLINPTVTNVYGTRAPIPEIIWKPQKMEREMVDRYPGSPNLQNRLPPDQRKILENPHYSITINLLGDLANPAFLVECDRPCGITFAGFGGTGSHSWETKMLLGKVPTVTAVSFNEPKLITASDTVVLDVSSADDKDFNILKVAALSYP